MRAKVVQRTNIEKYRPPKRTENELRYDVLLGTYDLPRQLEKYTVASRDDETYDDRARQMKNLRSRYLISRVSVRVAKSYGYRKTGVTRLINKHN